VPALIGGILSAVYAACANYEDYHNLYNMYPARRPITTTTTTTTAAPEIALNTTLVLDVERTAGEQAGFQLVALGVTIGIALVTGALTGLLLRLPLFEQLSEDVEMFDDEAQWVTPEDYALKLTFATNVHEPEEKDDSKV
jgi:ammonium transporter Rh